MNCEYSSCDPCKYKKNCVLRYGNKYTSKISKQIAYYLQLLDELYRNQRLYYKTEEEIRRGLYSTSYAQYTNIPLTDVFGDAITSPADVYYGLDIHLIKEDIKVTKDTINELRREELKVLKTLKRRERRINEYGY